MKQYFTELEAAEAAGVSLDTIKEFITLGMLLLNPADGLFDQRYLTRANLLSSFHNLKDLGETIQIPTVADEKPTSQSTTEAVSSAEKTQPTQTTTPPIQTRILDSDKHDTFIEHRSFELLDLNKSLKDQIEILKQERDWLRKRVETFEIRSERDQLLLMSETKTVQTLLPLQQPKQNFWSFALPWLSGKP